MTQVEVFVFSLRWRKRFRIHHITSRIPHSRSQILCFFWSRAWRFRRKEKKRGALGTRMRMPSPLPVFVSSVQRDSAHAVTYSNYFSGVVSNYNSKVVFYWDQPQPV